MPEPAVQVPLGAAQHRDDLKVIKGIGARIESLLNDNGITSWDDLARLDEVDQTELESQIDVPAPIDPESWIAQAKQLVARYPERTGRPNKREYRRTTDKKDRIRFSR
jgi:predicted flap endonuclease-1-like 5' DNA nuclease